MNKFYITTAIPYVNAKPHIGHALEFVQADVVARYHRLVGEEVKFLTGSDENAIKNVKAAEEAGVPVQTFIDKNAELFKNLGEKLNVSFDVFQKGSSPAHHKASQKLWELCKHDIYKKEYTGKYSCGCELAYEDDELNENVEFFEHPGKKLEEVSEENYFFKLSKYTNQIKELIENDEIKIVPENRKHEVLAFLKQGLNDISISRSNERAKNWGVPVPGDPSQRMYVWFDALNIYQSGIGFGSNEEEYKKWWPADVHVIGKGILRFHAIYWPAFLLSAGLKLPKTIFVHEYITINGEKMSKSIGNVIDPIQLINKYGPHAVRYYLLSKISPFEDADFSEKKFIETYNADLANGLGNLVARITKLCETANFTYKYEQKGFGNSFDVEVLLKAYKFNDALTMIWDKIKYTDIRISRQEPWKIKDEKELNKELVLYASFLCNIAYDLKSFLPDTSEKILKQFKGKKIVSGGSLFPRI